MIKARLIRTSLLLVVGLAIASLIAFYQIKSESKDSATSHNKNIVSKNFGGPFTLTDHTGKPVTDQDYEGQYRLIYFGFTYCPAICPTELQRINNVLKDLGEDGQKIQPLFITIDPERDTVEVMKNYVELFHPRLIGLTGTQAQIDQVKKAYKIYAAKVQDETMSDYTMDHSSFIYFLDPDDTLIRIFKMDDSVKYMVDTVQNFLK